MTDEQKFTFVRTLMGFGAPRNWLRSISSGSNPMYDPSRDPFNHFIELFVDEFGDRHAPERARQKLNALKCTSSVQSLVSSMRGFALQIPDITDAELIDKLISKLQSKHEVYTYLVAQEYYGKSFNDVTAMAIKYDNALFFGSRQRSSQNNNAGTRIPIVNNQNISQRLGPQPQAGGPTPMDLGAINSGSVDPRTLPKYDSDGRPRCYKCHEYGHLAAECPQRVGGSFRNNRQRRQ